MTHVSTIAERTLDTIALRFLGVDLQFRRTTHSRSSGELSWPKPWRARLVTTKNERAEYRVAVYGDTSSQAIANLVALVHALDRGEAPTP